MCFGETKTSLFYDNDRIEEIIKYYILPTWIQVVLTRWFLKRKLRLIQSKRIPPERCDDLYILSVWNC